MSDQEERRLHALYQGAPSSPAQTAAVAPRRPAAFSLNGLAPPMEPDPAWEPVWLQNLVEEAPRPWVWEGMVAPGAVTFLTGLWKVGKTTFLSFLLDALQTGKEFCGLQTTPARILVLSEEHRQHWIRRRDAMALGPHIAVVTRPFLMRPDSPRWQAFVAYEAEQVRARDFDLIVFDSLPNLWPVADENAAPVVQEALAPLGRLTDLGAAVLCLMHPAKGDTDQGRAIRGSGALGGWADILIELRRYEPANQADSRRVLTTYSRFDEAVPELVLEYDRETGYAPLGGRAAVKDNERVDALLECLPAGALGVTVEGVLDGWPEGQPKMSKRTAFGYLESLRLRGRITRSGSGRRGDPYRFAIAGSE